MDRRLKYFHKLLKQAKKSDFRFKVRLNLYIQEIRLHLWLKTFLSILTDRDFCSSEITIFCSKTKCGNRTIAFRSVEITNNARQGS